MPFERLRRQLEALELHFHDMCKSSVQFRKLETGDQLLSRLKLIGFYFISIVSSHQRADMNNISDLLDATPTSNRLDLDTIQMYKLDRRQTKEPFSPTHLVNL